MSRLPRAYLSFPISGHDINMVRENAKWRKEKIEASIPWEIVSPIEIKACQDCHTGNDVPGLHTHTRDAWMRVDLAELLKCEHIVMCPGWETSPGARAELSVALTAGIMPWLFYDKASYGLPRIIRMTDGMEMML